jgi:hypothetical protein
MLMIMSDRKRRQVGVSDAVCDICGAGGLVIVESSSARRGRALLDPRRRHRRTYELCPGCGMRYPVENGVRI